jgi:hypothetical protein
MKIASRDVISDLKAKTGLSQMSFTWSMPLTLPQQIGKDRHQAASKDQKRYNREILYHYPIIPYGIRRVM